MTSKIKVDNIENQCGGAVVTKCGGTTTITGSVVKADDIQAADGGNLINQCGTTITLGASGDTINLASGASQSGFGRTGTVDWDTTAKTATFSAVSGNGYFCNTSGGAFTVNLPAGSAGAIVSVADYAGTWQTNNLTVAANGTDKIGGITSASIALNTEGQSVTFVFVDSTQGWINTMDSTSNVRGNPFLVATGGTISTSGNCKIHTFTGPGTFTVTNASATAAENVVSYLAIAGGGGGGKHQAGGGGAGGYREVKSPVTPYTASPLDGYPSAPNRVTVTATAFPITVGGGGAAGTVNCSGTGSNGFNSTFSTITSAGGGGGGGYTNTPTGDLGENGGSGGGGSSSSQPGGGLSNGGSGNTPPVSPSQGNNGGGGYTPSPHSGGGGGGAGAVGQSITTPGCNGGAGGTGVATSINASSVTRGGGGGGSAEGGPAGGAGGAGGGGAGGRSGCYSGAAATVNTGGGGGGGASSGMCGANGGSGIVIIRYKFQ